MLETKAAVVLVNVTRAWQMQGKAEHRDEEDGWDPGECHMGVKGGDER